MINRVGTGSAPNPGGVPPPEDDKSNTRNKVIIGAAVAGVAVAAVATAATGGAASPVLAGTMLAGRQALAAAGGPIVRKLATSASSSGMSAMRAALPKVGKALTGVGKTLAPHAERMGKEALEEAGKSLISNVQQRGGDALSNQIDIGAAKLQRKVLGDEGNSSTGRQATANMIGIVAQAATSTVQEMSGEVNEIAQVSLADLLRRPRDA